MAFAALNKSSLSPARHERSMRLSDQLCCLTHRFPLVSDNGAAEITASTRSLVCRSGCRIPVVCGIPRFVRSEGYAAGFGGQWKKFRRTQLDSFTGTTISGDRLTRCVGGSLAVLRDKCVLEVGCGAGRFTELLLKAGAWIFAS